MSSAWPSLRRQPALRWRPGLRWRATAAFTLGGLLLSMVLVIATYTLARGYLIGQRENSACVRLMRTPATCATGC